MFRRAMRRLLFMDGSSGGGTGGDRWSNMSRNFRRMLRRLFFIRNYDDDDK